MSERFPFCTFLCTLLTSLFRQTAFDISMLCMSGSVRLAHCSFDFVVVGTEEVFLWAYEHVKDALL